MKALGESVADFKAGGTSAAELLSKGFAVQELFDGGYTVEEIRVAGDGSEEGASPFVVPETYSVQMSTLLDTLDIQSSGISAGALAAAVLGALAVVGAVGYMLAKRNNQAASATTSRQARGQRKLGRTITTTTNPAFNLPQGSSAGGSGARGTASSSASKETCTRPSPSGGFCKNKALHGTSFCKGHSCPVAGCTSGKSTKMATCPDHVHGSAYAEPSSNRK